MTDVPPVRFHVADAVVARLAQLRAEQVAGVVAVRPRATASVEGGAAEVGVEIVTRLGHNCRDLAQAVQREVAATLTASTGLDATVTVVVADVLLEPLVPASVGHGRGCRTQSPHSPPAGTR